MVSVSVSVSLQGTKKYQYQYRLKISGPVCLWFVVCGAFERELRDQQNFFFRVTKHIMHVLYCMPRTYTELAANRYCLQGHHVEAMISIRQNYTM